MALLKDATVLPSGTSKKCYTYHQEIFSSKPHDATSMCGQKSKTAKLHLLFGHQEWHAHSYAGQSWLSELTYVEEGRFLFWQEQQVYLGCFKCLESTVTRYDPLQLACVWELANTQFAR